MNSSEGRMEIFRSARDLARKRHKAGDKYIITVFKEKITIDEYTPREIKTYLEINQHNVNVIKTTHSLDRRLRQVTNTSCELPLDLLFEIFRIVQTY